MQIETVNAKPKAAYQQTQVSLSLAASWSRAIFIQVTRVNSWYGFAIDDNTENIVQVIVFLLW